MVARPLMPQQAQPAPQVQHAQFRNDPSLTDQALGMAGSQLTSAAINKGLPMASQALGLTAAPAAAGAAGAGAAGAAGATGGLGGALAGLGGAGGAGLMAAAAPVAIPLAAGAALGKLFGLFKEGGLVPSETMTAVGQQAPQQNEAAPQTGGPLSFKHAEQQQKLALKQATFDADQKRKDEAHRMKMMQQQLKLTEAVSGFQTPLSAR